MKSLAVLLALLCAATAQADPVTIQDAQRKRVFTPAEAQQWPVWEGGSVEPGRSLVVIDGVTRIAPADAGQVSCLCAEPVAAGQQQRSLSAWWWLAAGAPLLTLLPRSLPDRPLIRDVIPPPALPTPEPATAGLLLVGLILTAGSLAFRR